MNHFEPPHLNVRVPPKPGDTVYLVPIRYWEPAGYFPEKFDVHEVTPDGFLYGFHHSYGHTTYVSMHDAKWFYEESNAREVQIHLAAIADRIDDDDMNPVMRKIDQDIEKSQRTDGAPGEEHSPMPPS